MHFDTGSRQVQDKGGTSTMCAPESATADVKVNYVDVVEICERTDRQTHRHTYRHTDADRNTSHAFRSEVIIQRYD